MKEDNNLVKYKDLLSINSYNEDTNKEIFVFLPEDGDGVVGRYIGNLNMLEHGNKIPVRKMIYEKLKEIDKNLKAINPNYSLLVIYGYRTLENQTKYFNEEYNKAKNMFDNELDLLEHVHEKIAVPSVSGHPTGGAVDICIYDNLKKEILDFGSDIHDFNTEKCFVFSTGISDIAKENRMLLRKLMLEQSFAPYNGEWWHFSYGDKEWAFYYKKSEALYNQVNSSIVFENN
mgnify:CR=1 FL=1